MARNQFAGAHVIDVDDLSSFMERERYKKRSTLDQIHKIYLSKCDKEKKHYEPSHLSIGPYHHGSPALHALQKLKWGYLSYFLELNHEKNLHDYIDAINGLEKQARSFYGDEIKMDRKNFVEMLLLDACFILMTLNGTDGISPDFKTSTVMDDKNKDQLVIDVDEDKQIIETNELHGGEGNSYDIHDRLRTKVLILDMLLLENQIPFFVIIKLYEILTRGRSSINLLVRNIVQSMKDMFGCPPESIQKCNQPEEIYHLLHLCHMYFKPSRREEEKKNSSDHEYETLTVRPVTQYYEARMELKKREFSNDTPYSLLDIRFFKGTLEIPCLSIGPETFTLLKNLIAFEQICPQTGNYVKSYVLFWSQFITTSDDVVLLIEKGIIRHDLHRDNEVIDQFKSLMDCVFFNLNDDNYLASLCYMMELHYRTWRPMWRKWLASIKLKLHDWTQHNRFELPI